MLAMSGTIFAIQDPTVDTFLNTTNKTVVS
jgi:hypothetical protein